MHRSRKTLAFVIDQLDQIEGGYETQLREGIMRRCDARGVSLVIVAGRPLSPTNPIDRVHNRIFSLIGKDVVDGAILLASSLGRGAGHDVLLEFVRELAPLPVCSIGLRLNGVPSITVDNATGVTALIDHLVTQHGARELAFLGGPSGNPEAQQRLAAFRATMAVHGLAVRPELTLEGDYTVLSGLSETRRLLQLGLRCDAVVAANDAMAFGVLDALREQNLRAPRDMLVTGFDNVASARHAMPPLTTARQPLAHMGALAVDWLLTLLGGGDVPQHRELPVEPVLRRSCGCGALTRSLTQVSVPPVPGAPLAHLRARRLHLEQALDQIFSAVSDGGEQSRSRLLDALDREMATGRDAFVDELEDLVREMGDGAEILDALQQVLMALREALYEVSNAGLESLWHAASGVIVSALARTQAASRLGMEVAYDRLRSTGERFSTALDMSALREALADEMPRLGVSTASISVFDEDDPSQLKPVFMICRGRTIESRHERFSAGLLVPPDSPAELWADACLLLPLCFEIRNFGVALFEFRASKTAYQMLREQISAAVRNIYLHQELLDMAAQRERSLQERIATAARMRSLSLLAGGVAHDLNNALGPLVVLPEMVQHELDALVVARGKQYEELRADLDTIKLAAARAARTVKDLMTLGRQGNAKKQVLDINEVVAACARTEPLRYHTTGSSGVRLVTEFDPEPMPVLASEAHVARAIANLVRNAVDALEERGEISVRTFRCTLKHPLAAYEVVDPGDYVVIEVCDNGRGIPAEALQRIFEPFFSQKALKDTSGSGLGLAIVHGVVKEHGGFLDVESTVGEGTTFRVFLPRSCDAPESAKARRQLGTGKGRVLVVDDEPTQLRTAKRVLERYGYVVETVSRASDVMGLFQRPVDDRGMSDGHLESGFDLVILDMALNDELDGLDLYEKLRDLVPTQRAMIVSGQAPSDRAKVAVEKGLAWLAKPYSIESLVRAVESVLGSRQVSDSIAAPP